MKSDPTLKSGSNLEDFISTIYDRKNFASDGQNFSDRLLVFDGRIRNSIPMNMPVTATPESTALLQILTNDALFYYFLWLQVALSGLFIACEELCSQTTLSGKNLSQQCKQIFSSILEDPAWLEFTDLSYITRIGADITTTVFQSSADEATFQRGVEELATRRDPFLVANSIHSVALKVTAHQVESLSPLAATKTVANPAGKRNEIDSILSGSSPSTLAEKMKTNALRDTRNLLQAIINNKICFPSQANEEDIIKTLLEQMTSANSSGLPSDKSLEELSKPKSASLYFPYAALPSKPDIFVDELTAACEPVGFAGRSEAGGYSVQSETGILTDQPEEIIIHAEQSAAGGHTDQPEFRQLDAAIVNPSVAWSRTTNAFGIPCPPTERTGRFEITEAGKRDNSNYKSIVVKCFDNNRSTLFEYDKKVHQAMSADFIYISLKNLSAVEIVTKFGGLGIQVEVEECPDLPGIAALHFKPTVAVFDSVLQVASKLNLEPFPDFMMIGASPSSELGPSVGPISYNHAAWTNPYGIQIKNDFNCDFENSLLVGIIDMNMVRHDFLDPNMTISYHSKETHGNHGTHVAGIIGAAKNDEVAMRGICSSIRMHSYCLPKVGNVDELLGAPSFLDNIEEVVKKEIIALLPRAPYLGGVLNCIFDLYKNYTSVRLVNISIEWQMESTIVEHDNILSAFESIIKQKSDCHFVISAGNGCLDLDTLPTFLKESRMKFDLFSSLARRVSDQITLVGASDLFGQIWNLSNFGRNTVSLMAPGDCIYSTLEGSSYGFMSGTSQAAPHVTAAFLVMLQMFPYLSISQIRDRLMESADVNTSLISSCLAEGRLNLDRAISLERYRPIGITPSDSIAEEEKRFHKMWVKIKTTERSEAFRAREDAFVNKASFSETEGMSGEELLVWYNNGGKDHISDMSAADWAAAVKALSDAESLSGEFKKYIARAKTLHQSDHRFNVWQKQIDSESELRCKILLDWKKELEYTFHYTPFLRFKARQIEADIQKRLENTKSLFFKMSENLEIDPESLKQSLDSIFKDIGDLKTLSLCALEESRNARGQYEDGCTIGELWQHEVKWLNHLLDSYEELSKYSTYMLEEVQKFIGKAT